MAAPAFGDGEKARIASTIPLRRIPTAEQIARTYELADLHGVNLMGAVTWAFEFEDQPYFAGFRALATNGIVLPVFNVFRMFSRMGAQRIAATSDGAVDLQTMLKVGVRERPDVVCLQELKAEPGQIPEACKVADYHTFWHGMRAYSGVSLHIRRNVLSGEPVFTHPAFDMESRIVQAQFGNLVLASVYVPNGNKDYPAKLEFFRRLPHPDKQFSVMAGVSHASFQQKNYLSAYHILHSFFTLPDPVYRG